MMNQRSSNYGAATCRSCGARILFIRTPKGKNMPCDPYLIRYKVDPEGKEKIVRDDGSVVSARTDVDTSNMDGLGYISHFATCQNANMHRHRKRS